MSAYILLFAAWWIFGFMFFLFLCAKISKQITIADLLVSCFAGFFGPTILFFAVVLYDGPEHVIWRKK